MDIKKIVWILVAVVLISFGLGIFSLNYNEEINLSWFRNNKINIRSNDAQVDVKNGKIDIKDGDSHVQVGWDGIDVKDGDDHVVVGWDGIKINDGKKSSFNLFSGSNWFKNPFSKTVYSKVDEERYLDMRDIDTVEIASSFVDVRVIQEDREDTWIKYYGEMESNVVPSLEVENKAGSGLIKLEIPGNSYTVKQSNVILEIFIPNDYNGDMSIKASSSDSQLKNLKLNNINLQTSSGDIDIENVENNQIKFQTSSGDIRVKNSTGKLKLSSSSGDMEIYSSEETGNMDLTTSSGDILLNFHDGANYTIKAITSSGDYTNDTAMNIVKNVNKGFEGVLGNGEMDINIVTSSGDVIFRR